MKREVRLFDELDRFSGGREISHALALTFGYDGDVAAERLWTPLIERYGVRHPLVIADGAVDEGTMLSVQVLRARRGAGVFHPKLVLAVREDAVFAAIGSANLTRGGLGANLELLTPLVFAADVERPPPRATLDEILGFVERVIAQLHVAESTRTQAEEVVKHARLVTEKLPERRRGAELRFLHSYEEPLWVQLRRIHGDDPVEKLLVVSPFFEDPDADEADSLLRYALSDGLPWAARARRPRAVVCAGALEPDTRLPRTALEELGEAVELRLQALSEEPRRLHGKLLAVFGKKRTTLMWGSPNFTPAALLRPARAGGNVECALALSAASASADLEAVLGELDLPGIFREHRGPVPEPASRPPRASPPFEIGELIYDPATRVLSLFGEVFDPAVRRVRVVLLGQQEAVVLLEAAVEGPGPISIEGVASFLEEDDPETGKRRLRALRLTVEGVDAEEATIARAPVRLNVRFEDALEVRQNLLLGADARSADALLMSSSAPPEQRAAALDRRIEAWRAARQGGTVIASRHQASLDELFRNVRLGLDAQWEGLARRNGSRFALLRWSHQLRRALGAAGNMEGPRRAYLVGRVAEHIGRVLEAVPGWHDEPDPAFAALEPDKLAEALEGVPLDGGVRQETLAEVSAVRAEVIAALREPAAGRKGTTANSAEKPRRRGRRGA